MMTLLTTLTVLLGLVASSRAVELTKDTWDDAVAGKAVFAKFLYVFMILSEPYQVIVWGGDKLPHLPCLFC
jgi:hypothetical protein